MSFLKRLMGGASTSADVQRLLDAGQNDKAMKATQRLLRDQPDSTELLLQQSTALAALLGADLERAGQAVDEGFPDDALEWVELGRAKLQQTSAETVLQSDQVSAVARALEEVADQASAMLHAAELDGVRQQLAVPEVGAEEPSSADVEPGQIEFEILVETLRPEIAELYRSQGSDFAAAAVALAEGDAESALTTLERIAATSSTAPVLLERGRALLALERFPEAEALFDQVWADLGDGLLDHQGALALPELWCEAALANDGARRVADRLTEMAESQELRLPLTLYRVESLSNLGEFGPAQTLLRQAVERHPGQAQLVYRLATSLLNEASLAPLPADSPSPFDSFDSLSTEQQAAVTEVRELLDGVVSAAMRSGGSGLDLATVELFCETLLVDEPPALARVEELLAVATHLAGGRMTPNIICLTADAARRAGDLGRAEQLKTVLAEQAGKEPVGPAGHALRLIS